MNKLIFATSNQGKMKEIREILKDLNVEVIETDLIKIAKGYVKHDSDHLAQILMTTILDKKLLYDKDKIIEYMYLSKKIGDRVK